MVTDLLRDQQQKLIHQIQEKPGYVDANTVTALVLMDILEVLQQINRKLSEDA